MNGIDVKKNLENEGTIKVSFRDAEMGLKIEALAGTSSRKFNANSVTTIRVIF